MNLYRYNDIKIELKNIESILQELNTQLFKISCFKISDIDKVDSSFTKKDELLIDLIEKIEMEKTEYINIYQEYYQEFITMKEIIDNFVGVEKTILIERYIKDKTWDSICNTTNYSRTQLYRIHKDILEKIKNMKQNGT